MAFISRSCIFRPPHPRAQDQVCLRGREMHVPTLAHTGVREAQKRVSMRDVCGNTQRHTGISSTPDGREDDAHERAHKANDAGRGHTPPKEAARAAAKEARSIAVVRGRSERFFARRADCICARQAGGRTARQQSCSSKGHSQTKGGVHLPRCASGPEPWRHTPGQKEAQKIFGHAASGSRESAQCTRARIQ